ncbi:carbohydrate-binding module family 13 protein [Mycena floridula]|nr:carbohydrate-binding module family 13 protein [Mycena floridula]
MTKMGWLVFYKGRARSRLFPQLPQLSLYHSPTFSITHHIHFINMRSISIVANFVLLAVLVAAQKPKYLGQLRIEPGLDGSKCLNAASNIEGAAVTIEDCSDDATSVNQKWKFVKVTVGKVSGTAVHVFGDATPTPPTPPMCLHVLNGDIAQPLQISACVSDDANQLFFYDYKKNTLTWSDKASCLDVEAADAATPVGLAACTAENPNQVFNVGYLIGELPKISETGQYGYNACKPNNFQSSKCQTAWINSASDFCLWAPPTPGKTVPNTERIEVAWCTAAGRGTRTIPKDTLKGIQFVKTKDYVQITGVGDFTKVNIPKRDEGAELDAHAYDRLGNPIGGLVYGNTFGDSLQYHEWSSFISDREFCFKACVGPDAKKNCPTRYDRLGCYFSIPGKYKKNVFEDCDGDDTEPAGIYGTSTFTQGAKHTPKPHPAGSTSNCVPTPTDAPLRRSRM